MLFGLAIDVVPMTDDMVTTRIDVFDVAGEPLDLHFQEYWVKRHAEDPVKGIRFEGIERAAPAPGVLDAITDADVLLLCPSNPVVSIGPILSVPGIRDSVAARSGPVVGVSPIVGGAPLAGMADKLMPAAGLEVSALGAARAYRDLLSGWVIDERDRDAASRIADELGIHVAVTDTVMRDDEVAAAVARTAVELAS
jgi:LPPG:FO 2-phospho-L-lactate transferase